MYYFKLPVQLVIFRYIAETANFATSSAATAKNSKDSIN